MVDVALIGVGKMGLSHLSMVRAHPDVTVTGVCDSAAYVLDVLGKYTGLPTFTDVTTMLDSVHVDAIVIATPTASHASLVRDALDRGLHVFCEKPLSLSGPDSTELAQLAADLDRVTGVGYHNRHVGAFREVKKLLDAGAIGRVTHALAESYGPVVLKPKGSTWRSRRSSGGGCLYDYAAHPLDLLAWYFGEAESAGGSVINSIFSAETDDEVYSLLRFRENISAHLSVNWSDESQRKMTTKISVWGTAGRIVADRQECQVFLRDTAPAVPGYDRGWNVRYTTELTEPVWFYLRGEEYSAQLDEFIRAVDSAVRTGSAAPTVNSFATAAVTDRVIDMIERDASGAPAAEATPRPVAERSAPARRRLFGRRSERAAS